MKGALATTACSCVCPFLSLDLRLLLLCELIGPGPVLTLPPPFLQRRENLEGGVWRLCT